MKEVRLPHAEVADVDHPKPIEAAQAAAGRDLGQESYGKRTNSVNIGQRFTGAGDGGAEGEGESECLADVGTVTYPGIAKRVEDQSQRARRPGFADGVGGHEAIENDFLDFGHVPSRSFVAGMMVERSSVDIIRGERVVDMR